MPSKYLYFWYFDPTAIKPGKKKIYIVRNGVVRICLLAMRQTAPNGVVRFTRIVASLIVIEQ